MTRTCPKTANACCGDHGGCECRGCCGCHWRLARQCSAVLRLNIGAGADACRVRLRKAVGGIAALCVAAIAGCSGSAWLSVVPLSLKTVGNDHPLEIRYTPDRCYYWIDEQDRLCIAMAFDNITLFGDYGKQSVAVSMVLDGMPAGAGRSYRATRTTLRMIAHRVPNHWRWASLAGTVSVWRNGADEFRGRFRIFAKQQSFHVALGWHGNQRAIMIGEFEAVRQPEAGRRILETTEADGMERVDVQIVRPVRKHAGRGG